MATLCGVSRIKLVAELASEFLAPVLRNNNAMTLPNRQTFTQPYGSSLQAEQQVEKLVADIAAVIRSAEPEKRGELKELTEALIRDEMASIGERADSIQTTTGSPHVNPLFAGILLTLLGVGFFLLFPLVGLALAAIGAALTIWGGVLSWLRR